jgi:hypothetical protein
MPTTDTTVAVNEVEPMPLVRLGTLRRFARSIAVDYDEPHQRFTLVLLGHVEDMPLGTLPPTPPQLEDEWTDIAREIGIVGGSRFRIGLLRSIAALDTALRDGEPIGAEHGFRQHPECPFPLVVEEL